MDASLKQLKALWGSTVRGHRLVNMSTLVTKICALLRQGAVCVGLVLLLGCAGPDEKAQSYYQRGSALLAQKDYVKAGIEFRNALQLKKDLVGAWRGLLQIEEHNRNSQAQVPILRNLVELDPKDVDSKIKLGYFLLPRNALNQALELADAAVELDSKNAAAWGLRAAVKLRLNDMDAATRDARAALQIDPANAEAVMVLAAERSSKGDLDGALSFLKGEDKNIPVQLFKIMLYEKKGDLKQVEALLQSLASQHPDEAAFRKSLVKLYINQKRNDDAEKEVRALAAADPANVEAGLNVVRFVAQIKGPPAAREELLARTKGAGDVFPYQLALAEFDFAQGRTDDAVRMVENLAKTAASKQHAVNAQVKLAQFQATLRKLDLAETSLAEVFRKDARNGDALRLRASLKVEKGNLDGAVSDLREALNDQPRSSDIMLLLAGVYERAGSIELAEKQYADATSASVSDPGAGLEYTNFLRRRDNLARAEEILTDLVRRFPSSIPVLTALADTRLARQNWAGAQSVAQAIKQISGSNGVADQITAATLSGRGDFSGSIKILEDTYSRGPNTTPALIAVVNEMIKAQQLDQATTFLQRVLKENPSNGEARVLLGSVFLMKNSRKEALDNFTTVITQQPKLALGYTALAGYHSQEKNYEAAETVLRAGLTQNPDDLSTHMALAGVLEAKHEFEGAISEYEYILKQQSNSLIVANNLASLLTEHRTDKASLERAYSLAGILRKSPVPSFKDTLGWILYLRGEVKTSIPLLQEAATALPGLSAVQYHLGMAYLADGQKEKASVQFKKALTLQPYDRLEQQIRAAQEKAAM